jgi:uncharacterized protein YerC
VGAGTLGVGALPILGALAGYLWELRRVYRRNVAFSEENNETLRDLARQNAEAVQEITALNQRHQEWSRLLEQQISARQRQSSRLAATATISRAPSCS